MADQAESVQGDDAEFEAEQAEPESVASGTPNLADGIGASLLEAYGLGEQARSAEEPAPEEPEPESEDEPEAEQGTEVPAAEEAKLTPEQQVPQWAQRVSANPKSISEVPAKFHPQVMEAVLQEQLALHQRAIEIAYQQGAQQAEARVKVDAEVARIDELKADDPMGFAEWVEQHPDRAEAYLQIKRGRTPQGQVQAQQQATAQQTYQAAAQPLLAKLAEYPEAQAQIAQLDKEPGRYAMSAEGFARLQADVTDALVAARMAAQQKTDEPARKAVEKRQQAADGRRNLPRPDVTGARGGASIDPLADINDPTQLIGMGISDFFKSETPKLAVSGRR